MNRFLRKYRGVIVWVVVFAFAIGGGLLGYGAYLTKGSGENNTQQVQAMAEVNGENVVYNDYIQQLQALGIQNTSGLSQQQILGYQYYALSNAIDRKLLLHEAKNQKIKVKVTNKEIDEYVDRTMEEAEITKKELENILRSRGMTFSQWKGVLKSSFAEDKSLNSLMDKVSEDVVVPEEEIIENYEKVRLSNIYVAKDGEESKAKIEEALAKIEAGEDFAVTVKSYSVGGNVEEGGDLGFMTRVDAYIEENLVNEAFSLEVGQSSGILETEGGYYIIKVTDKKLAEGEEFEAERVNIEEELLNTKKSEAQSKWFAELKDQANIVIHESGFAGYHALTQSDFETAAKKFEEALVKYSENIAYLSYLGEAYLKLEQQDKAIATFEKVVEISPEDHLTYLALGNVYKGMDDKEKAIEYYKKASDNAGDEYMVRFQLSSLFSELGAEDLATEEQAIIQEIANKIQEQQLKEMESIENEAANAESANIESETTENN
ncbi:MAG: peptidylprolyl isomerase [Halanaerobiales bacterium]|nr:peptidylprolyl isomerase [Halanaerobiales bacterium]